MRGGPPPSHRRARGADPPPWSPASDRHIYGSLSPLPAPPKPPSSRSHPPAAGRHSDLKDVLGPRAFRVRPGTSEAGETVGSDGLADPAFPPETAPAIRLWSAL